jgi:hypothetical protein
MKRIIVAVSLAALAAPALAAGNEPFEVTEFDRTLPAVQNPIVEQVQIDAAKAPFEVTEFDRSLPEVADLKDARDARPGARTVVLQPITNEYAL